MLLLDKQLSIIQIKTTLQTTMSSSPARRVRIIQRGHAYIAAVHQRLMSKTPIRQRSRLQIHLLHRFTTRLVHALAFALDEIHFVRVPDRFGIGRVIQTSWPDRLEAAPRAESNLAR